MNLPKNPRGPWWLTGLRGLLVLWAVALVFYFYVREGVIRWSWLFAEPGRPGLERPPIADAPVSPYLQILSKVAGPYHIQWENAPGMELLISLGMILGYTIIGWLLLSVFTVFIPRGAKLCLALLVGLGAVGIGCELLGIAHQLTRLNVTLLWGGLLAVGMMCALINRARRNNLVTITGDTQLTRAEEQGRAKQWFESQWEWPHSAGGWLLWGVFALLFALINFTVLLHAIGEPVVYWDSLILYVGYARGIFLEHGFPFKAVGQVGVGLGANYPHLYEVLTAQTATLAGYWSDAFAQLLPPTAVLAGLVLVYYTVLELAGNHLVAMATILLIRAVPYGMSYSQFATNYSVAILVTAAFAYLAVRLVRDGLAGYRYLLLLMAAIAMHINYLMLLLWPVAAFAIMMAHWNYRRIDLHDPRWQAAEPGTPMPVYAPEFMVRPDRPRLGALLMRGEFWLSLALCLAIASPWYIRNAVLTGNPVYAFYANIFPSIHVNPKVMDSAVVEWKLNGDGLANVGRTLPEKLAGSWLYFVTGNQHWKLAPVFMALVVPGALIWGLWCLGSWRSGRRGSSLDPAVFRAVAVITALFGLLWFYAYAIADFYLYQIITVLPLFGVYIAGVFMVCRGRARAVLYALTLLIGIAPGLVMGLMGFKLKHTGVYANLPAPQFDLTALRQLFMSPARYYRMEYGGDMDMIAALNNTLPENAVILTHENRHLLLRPDLKIVHLDDWEPQQVYGKPEAERIAALDALGVKHYLFVPNETKHMANSWLGMDELIRDGYFRKDMDTPSLDEGNGEYPVTANPRNMNVLYERTDKKP